MSSLNNIKNKSTIEINLYEIIIRKLNKKQYSLYDGFYL